ncbi:MAG: IS1634 family transposase [Candidatus Lokiarchaeota archaeon]|nr:IS1634 family transposase [Candidatus Lokiarchaeota archaeon]
MTYLVTKIKNGTPYYYEYESYRKDGKTKHRMVRYLGKTKDLAKSDDFIVKDIKSWGDVQALCSIANTIDFGKNVNLILQKGGGVEASKLLLILAINRILDPCSKNKMESWFRKTALDSILGVEPHLLSAQNLCSFLDYLTPDRTERIERNFTRTLKKKFNASTDFVIYDITSTYTYGSIKNISEYGYSRDHRSDLEQINIGLAVTERDYFPILHQIFEGNVPDVVTLPGTARILDDRCNDDNTPKMTLIYDRGFLSEDNIKILDTMDRFDFVCGAKKTNDVIENIDDTITDDTFEVEIKKDDGETIKGHSIEKKLYGRKRKIVVLFSSELKLTHSHGRKNRLKEASDSLKNLSESCEKRNKSHDMLVVKIHEALKRVQRYFTITINDHPECNHIRVDRKENLSIDKRKLTWVEKKLEKVIPELELSGLTNREIRKQINDLLGSLRKHYTVTIEQKKPHSTFDYSLIESEIKAAARYDGYHVLISSNIDHDVNDIIDLYDSKDGVEKAFYTIKHPIQIQPIRHWNPQRVRGHVYVCVVAYLLYSVARYLLRKNEISHSVLDSLDDLGEVKQYVKSYSKGKKEEICLTDISDHQSDLLSSFCYPA